MLMTMAKSGVLIQLLLCLFLGSVFATTSTTGKSNDDSEMVEYGDTSYSLLQRPPVDSKVVQAAREKIAIRLDIHAISNQLDQVGKFIRIAYNGLAMHSGLQGKVSILAIRVTKLGDESALTIVDFQRASDIALSALESTFWYIYHDEEDIARDVFASISSIAGDMARKAMELHQLYEQEVRNVGELLGATANTKEYEEHVRVNLTQLMNDYEARIKRASTIRQEALAAFNNYKQLFIDARKRMYHAIDDQTDPWKKIANAFTSFVGVEAYDFQAYKSAEEAYRQEKLKYMEEMEKQRKIKDEALAELEEFTHRVQTCRDDTKLADITIEALQSTLGGLKMVAILMLDAAKYWGAVQDHCDSMQRMGTSLAVEFNALMKKDVARRRELWRSPPFKSKALDFYAQWVAIGSVCEESMKGLKLTLLELREVIKENPTRKEALENVRLLAKSFKEDLARARKLLESKPQKTRMNCEADVVLLTPT